MINYAFYGILFVNVIAVIFSILLEKLGKKPFNTLVFPVFAFFDVVFSFLVFANHKQALQTVVKKLFFKEDFYLTYGFVIDQASTMYLLILSVICFCSFIFCYAFSVVGTSKDVIFSVLNIKIFFLKLAILATGFFQFVVGIEMALFLSGVLIVNGRLKEDVGNKFSSFLIFEIFGSFVIFIAFAIWLSLFGSDSFFDYDFEKINPKTLLILSILLWAFIWVKGALFIGNLSVVKTAMAHFPSFVVIATITFPLSFLIAITRLADVLLISDEITSLVANFAVATVLLSALLAIFEKDIASSLAFLLSSQLGLLVTYFALNGLDGFVFIAVFQIAANLLFFLTCGSLIEAFSSEYNLENMGGARRILPMTYSMMIFANVFMVIPYTSVRFLYSIPLINIGLTVSCFIFSFAVSRIFLCAFHGKTRAEDVVFARVNERSFFILMSMFIASIFLASLFALHYHYDFIMLRILSAILGVLIAVEVYLHSSCLNNVSFSFAEVVDKFFYKIIIMPILRVEISFKNKINNRLLNKISEKFITAVLNILHFISRGYQKENVSINMIFLILTFFLTIFFFVLFK